MNTAWWVLGLAGAVPLYAYGAYPLLLRLAGALRRPPPGPPARDDWPMITIVVPAHNEERTIARTVEHILATDYPAHRRQILVVSDASTDRTDAIVAGFRERGVDLLRLQERGGKTAAENAALSHVRGTIVVNTDASVRVHPQAFRRLVEAFADPTVGVASSRDVSAAEGDRQVTAGEAGYVGYEMWVRALETRVYGIVGASGSLYAIRSDLHHTLVPEALSRDFAAALIAREHGFRAVSVDEAICYVPRSISLRGEYRRKVRTMTRGLETLWYKRALMNPFRYGAFSWMLVSHKLARWLVPWALVLAVVAVAALALEHGWARTAIAALAVAALVAGVPWLAPDRRLPRVLTIPAYVMAGLVAAMHAWINALRGELSPVWQPTSRTQAS
jgi:cellulose synthase/poly-beta-1,6-N-acetylglucosamine synthase-like glycosyltransferase